MAQRRAHLLVSLNFDSLTDTITNLTGTLILVVVLVMGIAGRGGRAGKPPDLLYQQLALLQAQAQEVEQGIKSLSQRVMDVQSRGGGRPSGVKTPSRPAPVPAAAPDTKPNPPPAAPASKDEAKPPAQVPSLPLEDERQVRGPPDSAGAWAAEAWGLSRFSRTRFSRSENGTVHLLSRFSRSRAPTKGWSGTVALPSAAVGAGMAVVGAESGTAPLSPAKSATAAAPAEGPTAAQYVHEAIEATAKLAQRQAGQLEALRRAIEELDKRLRSERPLASGPKNQAATKGQRSPGPKPKGKAQEFRYSPPIEQFTTKTPIRFVCQDNRISILDPDEIIVRKLDALVAGEQIQANQVKRVEFELPEGDFLWRGEAGKGVATLEAVRKPGRPGETWEELQKPGSRFLKALEPTPLRNPKTHVVLFSVWPDSFEVYRKARELVWKPRAAAERYAEGWDLKLPGEPIRLTRQPGRPVYGIQMH